MAHASTHGARLGQKAGKLKVGNNNGQLCIANATSDGARKATWANGFATLFWYFAWWISDQKFLELKKNPKF